MQTPTVGRIVLYTLTAEDAAAINRRRTTGASIAERIKAAIWPIGAQAHIGNTHQEGDVVPLLVVRPWHQRGHYVAGESVLNGQAFLDGNDSFWVLSAKEGAGAGAPGTWCWPPRQ